MTSPLEPLLSSTEVAILAGVGTSSVKRWADSGLLQSVRTPGGHRRFERSEVERFLRTQPGAAEREQQRRDEWLELLSDEDSFRFDAALLSARARLGAWHPVADELGGVLEELGKRWAQGRIDILEEHVRSARLSRALSRLVDRLPVERSAPACLLATAEGDEHTLGLFLAELTLREAGWRTIWAGRKTPLEVLEEGLRQGGVAMLALSASSHSQQPRRLSALVNKLVAACRAADVTLVLGGKGAWPAPPAGAHRFDTFNAFHDFALRCLTREHAQRRGSNPLLSSTPSQRRA